MNFGNVVKIGSQALDMELVNRLYPNCYAGTSEYKDRKTLEMIYEKFTKQFQQLETNFTCFVFKDAIEAFVTFANKVYNETRHEATGLIVGYYLHDPSNPSKKIVVATDFLYARGNSSNVTCEFSYEDGARHVKYCEEHKVLPIIWIHSHPGFGVFYSSTDSATLKNYFNCDHQLGIVVDNKQDQYLAYKIINGKQTEIDIWGVDFNRNDGNGNFKKFLYNNKPVQSQNPRTEKTQKKPVSFKQLQENNPQANNSLQATYLKKVQDEINSSCEEIMDCMGKLANRIERLEKIAAELSSKTDIENKSILRNENFAKIMSAIEDLKNLIYAASDNKQNFDKIEKTLSSLNGDLVELKNICSDEKNAPLFESINQSIHDLSTSYASLKDDTSIEKKLKDHKKERYNVIIIVILIISMLCNILLIGNMCSHDNVSQLTNNIEMTENNNTNDLQDDTELLGNN